MNKINHLLLLTLAIVASAFASLDYAEATVGGPTTISAIAHDSAQGSVYYTVHDGGGRGCPPIIHIIDLLTLKDRELKSCGDVEQDVFSDDGQANLEKYAQYRTDVYDKLSYMGSISLKKNNIDIRVTHLKENLFEDYVISNEFRATVMQDGKELAKIDFRGCAKDQPHMFEGYMIPNSDALALLISNKTDCFEGGYIGESITIVKGVKYYDTTIIRSIKSEGATEPNLANMIVYAGAPSSELQAPDTKAKEKNLMSIVLLSILGAIVCIIFGYLIGRKSVRSY